jgi:MoaA/NifB/PqqE/SkfB family radical SAM enzyme
MKPCIDIIYNMTLICPHDCPVCCVDAAHVTRRGDYVYIRTEGLSVEQQVPRGDRSESIYDVAARTLQRNGRELLLEQKLRMLEHLDMEGVRLDISGGDPLVVSDNLCVLKEASAKLGRDFVTLTATGAGMARIDLAELVPLVGEFNFTFDSASKDDVADRPPTYASRNLVLGRALAQLGAKTRAEFPITRSTSDPDHVRRLYLQLHEAGIDKLLLMRLFTVGRGHVVADKTLSADEYLAVIMQLRALEREFGRPVVSLQCALRHLEHRLDPGRGPAANPCDFVRESFGLTPQGILLASPWAINARGQPLDEAFVLGNLVETPLSQILAGPRITEIRARADENFGQCKIFAWQHSSRTSSFERLFDRADPLYEEASDMEEAAE